MSGIRKFKHAQTASQDELRQALRELVPLQERYTDLYDEAPCGYVTCDARRHMTGVNRTFARLVDRSPHALIDQPLEEFIHSSATDQQAFAHHWERLSACAAIAQCEVRLRVTGGAPLLMRLDGRSYFDPAGRLFEVRITVSDITAQRRAEEAVRRHEAMYRHVLELTPNPLFVIARDGLFRDCNGAALMFLGMRRDELLRANVCDVFRVSGSKNSRNVAELLWTDREAVELDYAQNGRTRTVHAAMTRVVDGGEPQVFVIGTEVTAHKRTESTLRHDILHDGLTGLPNRQYFLGEVDRALKRMRRQKDYRFGLLFIDLDEFKRINDHLGHLLGDELLQVVAERLQRAVRGVDVLARFAGDEFTMLIKDVSSRADVDATAHRVLATMQEPIHVGDAEVRVHVSVGGTVSRPAHSTASQVVREADDAMYGAKREGRHGYVPFGGPTQRLAHGERQTAEARLRRALAEDRMTLHYQPIFDVASGRELLGVEALVRWPQEDAPSLLPADFLSVMNEMGMCAELTTWVVRRVCRQIMQWSSDGVLGERAYASVNICPPLLRGGRAAGLIEACLVESGVDPVRLAVEVPVSALLEVCKGVGDDVAALDRLGIRIVVNDFGAPHAEMGDLCSFPVRGVKIGPSFVRMLEGAEREQRMLRGLVAYARGLGFPVTAVGVETACQLDELRKARCEAAQGFLFSEPAPADELAQRVGTGLR